MKAEKIYNFLVFVSLFIFVGGQSLWAMEELIDKEEKMLVARRGPISIPAVWQPYRIHGRDFWLEMPFDPSVAKERLKAAGIYDDPMYQEAALRVNWRIIQEPKSPLYKELLNRDNPVVIRSGYFRCDPEMRLLKKEDFDRFIKDFGDRFIGIHSGHETMGWHTYNYDREAKTYPKMKEQIRKEYNTELILPEPILDLETAYEAHRRYYQAIFFHQPHFINYNYNTTATIMNHFIYEMGAKLVSAEITACGGMNTQACMAFSRGAARQFKRPWGVLIACWGGGAVADGTTIYAVRFPWCRGFFPGLGPGWDAGPYGGPSKSLQKRQLYISYMSGANLIVHESDSFMGGIYVANYDEQKEYSEKDWLPTLLSDRKYYWSTHGKIFREFYHNIVKEHDRGVTYTPIALLFDQYNGFSPVYNLTHLLGVVPFSEADNMMRATLNTIWPYEHRGIIGAGWNWRVAAHERGDWETYSSVSGPFGDIFDAITNFAELDTLKSYPVIITIGRVKIDDKFTNMIKDYVRSGGTFLINVKQLPETLSDEDFIGCRITDRRHSAPSSYSYIDDFEIHEDKEFEFTEVVPTKAKVLVSSMETTKPFPLVLRNRYGKGAVILTTPDYLKVKGSKNKMLNLFSYLVRRFADELVPFRVKGDVGYIINRNKNGWVVTLVNNEGVYKFPARKEIIKPEEAREAIVMFKGKALRVLEWTKNKKLKPRVRDGRTVIKIVVPPGEIKILEFWLQREGD